MMPLPWRRLLPALLALMLLLPAPYGSAVAAEALVAVAANFRSTAEVLQADFEAAGEHELVIISGSTGKLYTQITNGAPFDLFLAADAERPRLLAAAGISNQPPRTYASGRLGIWISGERLATENPAAQLTGLRRIALANPSLAPYGAAALSVIDHLGIRSKLEGRLAYGENVAQAYAMVAAGAAEGGLIAWSLLQDGGKAAASWPVPESWHPPLNQDAVLLEHGADNPAAQAFYSYLFSPAARAIIGARGYVLPER